MTLFNPWALAGLALVLIPILVHLFARRRTRVLPFPTLRFIAPSRLLPVRTLRLSDPLLLAVRCAIIVAAALALAQPRFRSSAGPRAAPDVLARVVLVDTSASMGGGTGSPRESAREHAARLADEADVSTVVESAEPAAELAGAAEWLRHQPGAREIVVVSDFQLGALDSAAIADVPAAIGLDFVRVSAALGELAPAGHIGGAEIVARAVVENGTTSATWSIGARSSEQSKAIIALAADADSAAARATIAAASAFAASSRDSARAVVIVFPGHAQRSQLEQSSRPPNAPWMADALAAAWDVAPVAHAGVADVDGRERLLLFTDVAPGSVEAAALTLAVANAVAARTPASERDSAVLPDAELDKWRRVPGAVTAPQDETEGFDGRWFWLLALALLALETVLRRSRRDAP